MIFLVLRVKKVVLLSLLVSNHLEGHAAARILPKTDKSTKYLENRDKLASLEAGLVKPARSPRI